MPFTTSRREVLRKLGASVALAPFVPLLGREVEAAETPPRRLVIIQHTSGVYGPAWMPTGTETTFKLGTSTAPLERHRADLLFFKGLSVKEDSADDPHPCQPTLLTNVVRPMGTGASSLDQIVAAEIGKTRIPYMHTGFRHVPRVQYSLWWKKGTPLPTENSVYAAFGRVFDGFSAKAGAGPDEATLRRLSLRRSVLDHVTAELQALRPKLGGADRQMLEAHTESVRSIEHLLIAPAQANCAIPAAPKEGIDPKSDRHMPANGKAFMDTIVGALACDQTRVATLAWRNQGGKQMYSWLGGVYAQVEHHAITHGTGAPRSAAAAIDRWNIDQLAYFLDRLKSIREGAGTLLDNTLVLWMSEFGAWTTSQHWRKDMPFVIAGGKWAFKTGRFLRYDDQSHGRLMTAIAQAFVPGAGHIGSTKFGSGPLPDLT